jgi:hypothetical protein
MITAFFASPAAEELPTQSDRGLTVEERFLQPEELAIDLHLDVQSS